MARLLLMEDEPQLRVLLQRVLERKGHKVSVAANGAAGLNEFLACRPDLVLLDLLMPVLDGADTFLEIRKIDLTTPVIAMSAGGLHESRRFLKVSNLWQFNYILMKPFEIRNLYLAVNEALGEDALERGA